MRGRALEAVAVAGSLVLATPATAQVFEWTAGTSSLLGVRGASLQAFGGNYTGRIGVGFRDAGNKPLLGASLEASMAGWRWNLGDQSVDLALPTDLFGRSYPFNARGAAAARKTSRSDLLVFGGATSSGFSTPFFQSATARSSTGLVFYDRQLSGRLRGFSRNMVSTRRTSIQGLEWSPTSGCRLGVAAGVGNDEPYGMGSLALDTRWLALRATYALMGAQFRRLPAEGIGVAESDRENVRLELKPHAGLHLTLSRQNLAALSGGDWTSRSTNAASFGWGILGLRTQASLFRTDGASPSLRGYSLGVQRAAPAAFDCGVTYFRSHSGRTVHQNVVTQLRERLSPRLSLTQVVTTGSGQTSVALGGQLLLSRGMVAVDHQTTYVPIARIGQSAFSRAAIITLRVPLPGQVRLSATTQVDPMGRVRYTACLIGYAYGRPVAARRGDPGRTSIAPFAIRGCVVDASGNPVAGAALRVDDQLVFTDSRGLFEVRRRAAKACAIEAALGEFMFPGTYEVISMPATVRPASGDGSIVRIVLRRVK